MLVLLSLLSAHAQVPGLSLTPKGEVRWVTEQVEAQRFPASATAQAPGPTLIEGEEVELVVVEGQRARVKKGERYGWVPVSALTDQAPASAELPELGSDLLGQPLLGAPPKLEAPPDIGAGMGAGGSK